MAISYVDKSEYSATSGSSHTITIPVGARIAGNVAVVNVAIASDPASGSGDGSWFEMFNGRVGNATYGWQRRAHYIKRLDGSETGFEYTCSSGATIAMSMTVWSGVNPTGNAYHTYTHTSGRATDPSAPSITTSVANCMLLISYIKTSQAAASTFTGYTNRVSKSQTNIVQQDSYLKTNTGSTGTIASSGGTHQLYYSVVHLALAPASDEDPIIIMCGL